MMPFSSGFTQKQALLRHERIHSGDKPYSCKLCGRAFSDYSIIRRHMMLLHKKDARDWRGDIVSNLKKKKDYYIEGGPGHHVRELKPLENTAKPDKAAVPPKPQPAPVATEQQQVQEQTADFPLQTTSIPTTGIQDLSQSHVSDVTLLPLLYDPSTGSTGSVMQHTGTDSQTANPSPVRYTSNPMPINYSLTSAYSSGTADISPQSEIPDPGMGEVAGPYHNAQRNPPRQWMNPAISPAVSTMSSLPEQMRGQLTLPSVPSGPGLPGDTTHSQLIHPWAYGGYGPYGTPANLHQYPRNSQS